MSNYQVTPLPTAVPEVIDRLGQIVAWAKAEKSPIGYFAAVYQDVTRHIHDEIEKGPPPSGTFEDPERMRRFDVVFANRFIAAFDAWYSDDGGDVSRSWKLAFDTAATERAAVQGGSRFARLPVLVHLLLGVNAHMNLDLGCAASTIAPGDAIEHLSGDFRAINEVLDKISPHQTLAAERVEPLTRLADRWGWLTHTIIDADIEARRASSWEFAKNLAAGSDAERAPLIAGRDEMVEGQGRELLDLVQSKSWSSWKRWLLRPLVLLDTLLTSPVDEVIDSFGKE